MFQERQQQQQIYPDIRITGVPNRDHVYARLLRIVEDFSQVQFLKIIERPDGTEQMYTHAFLRYVGRSVHADAVAIFNGSLLKGEVLTFELFYGLGNMNNRPRQPEPPVQQEPPAQPEPPVQAEPPVQPEPPQPHEPLSRRAREAFDAADYELALALLDELLLEPVAL